MYRKRRSKRLIQTYLKWINGFLRFHNNQHLSVLFDADVEVYRVYLVNQKKVAANTQSIALNAISLLCKEIIKRPLSLNLKFVKSGRQAKLPTVLTVLKIHRCLHK